MHSWSIDHTRIFSIYAIILQIAANARRSVVPPLCVRTEAVWIIFSMPLYLKYTRS